MKIYSQFPIPDLMQARRILCIQPHYDDNDIGAGGILAALHDQGAEIIYLTVTNDLVGVLEPSLSDEQATAQLQEEQRQSGSLIGVARHFWLGCPDAGDYDYFEVRRLVIAHIRMLKPDFLFTCDPWLLYEAHRDHVMTGLAVAEASYLHTMPRLASTPQADRDYLPYDISGVAFYYTSAPNAVVDIGATRSRKHHALDCYQAQFTPEDLEILHARLEQAERAYAEVWRTSSTSIEYGEALKVLHPYQLHVGITTWKE
jgi:LmbE family N-acetylglucosaminyl deacetylase